jgi:dinuclear metal center YbgI/SA1388 family protein
MKTAKVSDILGIINKIAPPDLAETWDNTGLQLGDPTAEVTQVMVALDATPAVIQSAIESSCQLLVTHHPLIFKPQKSISTATPQGHLIHTAIRSGLSVISMHTNYDIAPGGLNDVLAERLGLSRCKPLQTTTEQQLAKLVVFVPADYLDKLRTELYPYAAVLGAYCDCSFATPGEGTFTPQKGARPHIGSVGQHEQVAEQRLELLIDRNNLPRAIKALLAAHPYEEPAFDIYPLLNQGDTHGLGRIGHLSQQLSLADLAAQTERNLQVSGLRYVGNPDSMVSKVAICSGSGASLLRTAARAGADVLITGDIKYHDARDAEGLGMALIDAGHYSTEIIMVAAVQRQLEKMLSGAGFENCIVKACTHENDPFRITARQ